MTEQDTVYARLSRFTAFTTLGVLGTTQDIVRTCLEKIPKAEPENVAEEVLCLVAITTARAAEVGLRQENGVASAVSPTILDLPFAYRDYLIGGAMITKKDTTLLDANEPAYKRLQDKREFYLNQFPENQFPNEPFTREKMEIWVERISPINLSLSPNERLEDLQVLPILMTHLKLVLAFGRQG
ncbi:MAG: hypothetical protein KTR29_07770 [Rhodothermaceae bacterium]|nr:hypothetical protein [Rhodothermaceae bacterium]